MDSPAKFGAVVTAPMKVGQVVINYSISCRKFNRDAAWKRNTRILFNLLVLFRSIGTDMTAGHDPQDIVVVQRDVPLYRGWPVGKQIDPQIR
ncbi:MAG: hypothetical protein JW384_00528 [Nitrosomonadaceae bacterium]|nr:hypothetical protein [Nitrosomonadaceae bacterium]